MDSFLGINTLDIVMTLPSLWFFFSDPQNEFSLPTKYFVIRSSMRYQDRKVNLGILTIKVGELQ